jgi:succinyl-CoA synthetase alpha subunit
VQLVSYDGPTGPALGVVVASGGAIRDLTAAFKVHDVGVSLAAGIGIGDLASRR